MSEEEDIDALAAEYALGSLPAGERSEVEARRKREPALERAICEWERRLAPLSLAVPDRAPPRRTLGRLFTRLLNAPAGAVRSGELIALEQSRRRWRSAALAFGSMAAMLALAVVASLLPLRAPMTPLAGVLVRDSRLATADEPQPSSGPTFMVAYDPATQILVVRQISGRVPGSGRVYGVWLRRAGEENGRPLGILARGEAATRLVMARSALPLLLAEEIVITHEAEAGARADGKLGTVISVGRLQPVDG